ncbi:MAG: 30S ribosome-binding factor RbfA [Lentisphaeria bacterium]|jgi:ribosome-binding factor A|nr:30S ribosome-binding factor RbfA [Lentisphaeria bacterium]MBR4717415.1 30S ribosome-binding factor RbfA [Lentisphaeria bacterium]
MPRNNRKHPVASVDRLVRVNELLKRVLADLLETLGYNEEQGKIISITRVDCASNLKTASVYVSILGAKNEEEEARIVRRLIERKSEIQSLMSKEVILKYTPVLHFVLDHSVADGDRVLDLLRHMEDENAGN